MYPFDPRWDLETLVDELNEQHRPGSVVSGKARNVLIYAWALAAGRSRAEENLEAAIRRRGSRSALARDFRMSTSTLREFESYVSAIPETLQLPRDTNTLREALAALPEASQLDFAAVASELLGDPALLNRLASSRRDLTRLLETALRAAELHHAVSELSNRLDGGVVDESAYQDWCDDHSWVFGGAHQIRDDVRRIEHGSIADLLLPDVVGYRDVVEPKRPDADVLKFDPSHKTFYFSSGVSKALGQVHKYLDALHERARHGLESNPNIVAYHPRATIVIGRSAGWTQAQTEALRGLNQRLHGIDVITYDHLLGRARILLDNLNPAGATSARRTVHKRKARRSK